MNPQIELQNTSYPFQKYSTLAEARKKMGSKSIRNLLQKAHGIANDFRSKEAELVQVLKEVDDTKAYRQTGYNSLFQFCVEYLSLSEHQAYSSITVARKMKEIPELLEPLKNGRLTVSKIRRMASVINAQNKQDWISLAERVSQKDLEKAVRSEDPLPPVIDRMQLLSDQQVKLQGTLSTQTSEKFSRVLELLREKAGQAVDYDEAMSQLCDLFLDKQDPIRRARRYQDRQKERSRSHEATKNQPDSQANKAELKSISKPPCNSKLPSNSVFAQQTKNQRRPLPTQLKHQVWLRDQGQCRFHRDKIRCSKRIYLQIHHKVPISSGGKDNLQNLVLLCSEHHRALHLE